MPTKLRIHRYRILHSWRKESFICICVLLYLKGEACPAQPQVVFHTGGYDTCSPDLEDIVDRVWFRPDLRGERLAHWDGFHSLEFGRLTMLNVPLNIVGSKWVTAGLRLSYIEVNYQ